MNASLHSLHYSNGLQEETANEFASRLPYLKLGASHSEVMQRRSSIPVFGRNALGDGLANTFTEEAVHGHLMDDGRTASRMYRAALTAISQTNARLRENDKPMQRFTIELSQSTITTKDGFFRTDIRVKVTRID